MVELVLLVLLVLLVERQKIKDCKWRMAKDSSQMTDKRQAQRHQGTETTVISY